jgi:hypothetical protein
LNNLIKEDIIYEDKNKRTLKYKQKHNKPVWIDFFMSLCEITYANKKALMYYSKFLR